MERTKQLLIVNAWIDLFEEVKRLYLKIDKETDWCNMTPFKSGLCRVYGDILYLMRKKGGRSFAKMKTRLLLIVNAWNDLFDEVERQYLEIDKEIDYRTLTPFEAGLRRAYGDILDMMREKEGDTLK